MTPTATSRVLLVPEARAAAPGPHGSKVRRYRLARLRLLQRREADPARFPHLTQTHD